MNETDHTPAEMPSPNLADEVFARRPVVPGHTPAPPADDKR